MTSHLAKPWLPDTGPRCRPLLEDVEKGGATGKEAGYSSHSRFIWARRKFPGPRCCFP